MSTAAPTVESAAERQLGRVLPPWWLLLITGVGWSLVGLIMLRFDYTSVHAISLLFGFVGIAAGLMEILMIFMAAGYYGRSAVLLIAWVAAFAIIRGVRDFVLAFRLRGLQHA